MIFTMSPDKYKIQLEEYGFRDYPRHFGNPAQVIVRNFEELYCNITFSISQCKSCFISHNAYPLIKIKNITMKDGSSKTILAPEIIKVECVLNDFDSEEKPENALADARNLSFFIEELGLDWISDYSGGKGFHFIVKIDPMMYWFKFGENETSADSLKLLIQTIQGFMQNFCELRTVDPSLFSDAKRIIRAPWTPYFKEKIWNGRYCIPLTKEQLQTWNITQILDASRNPTFEVVKSSGGDRLQMEELITFLGAGRFAKPHVHALPPITKTIIDDITVEEILLAIKGRQAMCIYDQLRSRNPRHWARIYWALFLMKYWGFREGDVAEVNAIWERFGKEFNYDDEYNYEVRIGQIHSIIDAPKYQNDPNPPNCTTLKLKGLCYCDKSLCPKYRE